MQAEDRLLSRNRRGPSSNNERRSTRFSAGHGLIVAASSSTLDSLGPGVARDGCHHGRETRSRSVGPFSFRLVEHPAGQHIERHDHETAMLVFVLRGGFRESSGASGWDLGEQGLVYRAPGEAHVNRFSEDGASCLIVEIAAEGYAGLLDGGALPEGVVCQQRGRASVLGRSLLCEWGMQDRLSPLAAEGFVLAVMEDLARVREAPQGTPPAWLARAEELLRSRLAERLQLDEIAAEAGVHPVTLARQFRRHHHCTVGEFLRAVRAGAAAHQLAHSTASLTRIALATGFCDQSHMTRVLRRTLGLTPGRLRAETAVAPGGAGDS